MAEPIHQGSGWTPGCSTRWRAGSRGWKSRNALVMDRTGPLKVTRRSSSPQDFGTRLHLEMGPFEGDWVKTRPLGWALIQSEWCLYKERRFGRKETAGCRCREERPSEDAGRSRVCRPRREAAGGPNLPTPDLRPEPPEPWGNRCLLSWPESSLGV